MRQALDTTAALAADHLIGACGAVRPGERVLIVCDESTAGIAALLRDSAERARAAAEVLCIPALGRHGQEPPETAVRAMLDADLVIGLTRHSMAHTRARQAAAKAGARYLSLPDYSPELLNDPAVLVDYAARRGLVRRFADAFTAGQMVHVRTKAGTDIRIAIDGRTGNACPGCVSGPGDLGSPPDIEANVSPLETGADGVVVVDGSIPCPEIGLLRAPVTLRVEKGAIVDFAGPEDTVSTLHRMFAAIGSPKAYVLAECGVGLNDRAKLTGVMLTDEGAFGTMHFGFGSNATVGGLNDVPFHLDFVFHDASLSVDGIPLLIDGKVAEP